MDFRRLKSRSSCVSWGKSCHLFETSKQKGCRRRVPANGPGLVKLGINRWTDANLLIGTDLPGPFSREANFFFHLKTLKFRWERPKPPCGITSLLGQSVAGAGAKTFHAWLPKIITFSAYVFGEGGKKSIFFCGKPSVFIQLTDTTFQSILNWASLRQAAQQW